MLEWGRACRRRAGRGQARAHGGWSHRLGATLLLVTGCTTTGQSLSVDVDAGVVPRAVATYTIEVQEMPGFLVPYFRDELAAALAARGVIEASSDADVAFVLRFSQLPLGEKVDRPDTLGESTGSVDTARFLARVELFARARGAQLTRLGMLSRAHAVATGAYMHERARAQIRSGFTRLLAAYIAPRSS